MFIRFVSFGFAFMLLASIATVNWGAAPAANAGQASAPQAGAPAQPDLTAVKTDFVPGEKTIFYDDFSDMAAGDAPAHFKVRGPAPELRVGGGIHQLTAVQTGSIYPNLTSLPKNFSYEAEVQFENLRNARTALILYTLTKQKEQKEALIWWINADPKQTQISVAVKNHTEELAKKTVPINWSQPAKIALWVQNGRVRAFINGEKHVDANQVELPEISKVEILSLIAGAGQAVGYRSVRFAESTPDFSQVIASSGRYVSHGILFDTGSDRLKPESATVIQSIARGLETNPNLKLQIEGHTDSVGTAAQNLDLSKRRAEAVKAVLVSQFKVDPARLTTAGLGQTKPIDTNDTPQGRAQNRRVEFVKQ
jgi:outer membrane protein OmpA-like peptidoglycan-associated protein